MIKVQHTHFVVQGVQHRHNIGFTWANMATREIGFLRIAEISANHAYIR